MAVSTVKDFDPISNPSLTAPYYIGAAINDRRLLSYLNDQLKAKNYINDEFSFQISYDKTSIFNQQCRITKHLDVSWSVDEAVAELIKEFNAKGFNGNIDKFGCLLRMNSYSAEEKLEKAVSKKGYFINSLKVSSDNNGNIKLESWDVITKRYITYLNDIDEMLDINSIVNSIELTLRKAGYLTRQEEFGRSLKLGDSTSLSQLRKRLRTAGYTSSSSIYIGYGDKLLIISSKFIVIDHINDNWTLDQVEKEAIKGLKNLGYIDPSQFSGKYADLARYMKMTNGARKNPLGYQELFSRIDMPYGKGFAYSDIFEKDVELCKIGRKQNKTANDTYPTLIWYCVQDNDLLLVHSVDDNALVERKEYNKFLISKGVPMSSIPTRPVINNKTNATQNAQQAIDPTIQYGQLLKGNNIKTYLDQITSRLNSDGYKIKRDSFSMKGDELHIYGKNGDIKLIDYVYNRWTFDEVINNIENALNLNGYTSISALNMNGTAAKYRDLAIKMNMDFGPHTNNNFGYKVLYSRDGMSYGNNFPYSDTFNKDKYLIKISKKYNREKGQLGKYIPEFIWYYIYDPQLLLIHGDDNELVERDEYEKHLRSLGIQVDNQNIQPEVKNIPQIGQTANQQTGKTTTYYNNAYNDNDSDYQNTLDLDDSDDLDESFKSRLSLSESLFS